MKVAKFHQKPAQWSGLNSQQELDILSTSQHPDLLWCHPASYIMDTSGSFSGGNVDGV
jgi:hypothetical protein